MKCPICGQPLIPTQIDERLVYSTEEGDLVVESRDVPVEICSGCGESFSGPDAARIRHVALCRTHGFLLPDEIRGIREALDQTQEEFASLMGVGSATISQWERGGFMQSRAHDLLLRVYQNVPEAVHFRRKQVATTQADTDSTMPDATIRPIEGGEALIFRPMPIRERTRIIDVD